MMKFKKGAPSKDGEYIVIVSDGTLRYAKYRREINPWPWIIEGYRGDDSDIYSESEVLMYCEIEVEQ
jgi:hypothetical protein